MESLVELLSFLDINQRLDLKAVSLTHVLSLTGSEEGKSLLLQNEDIVRAVIKLGTDPTKTVAKDAVLVLINLTADDDGAQKVFDISKNQEESLNLVQLAVSSITDEKSELADPWAMLLCNLTRTEKLVDKILDELDMIDRSLLMLVKAFCRVNDNKKVNLHYLGPFFCNLTQSSRGRDLFCNHKQNLFQRISCFVNFNDSVVRRGGTIGVLKNICFDPAQHHLILDEEHGALHSLLYPLAGSEEFTEEENEKFPMELQYLDILGEKKQREEDPDLRRMILESLLQLCATKKSREYLRSKGTYEILREYHKWESSTGNNKDALLVCEKVVDILIRKEEEIGIDNLKEVDVPDDLQPKFEEDDKLFLED